MSSQYSTTTIAQQAETLLRQHGSAEPPVPILNLIESQGLVVRPTHFDEYAHQVAGYLDPEIMTLFLNEADSPLKQTETMGYGLGLWQLFAAELAQDPDLRVCYRQLPPLSEATQPQKMAACFAAHVLVPNTALERFTTQAVSPNALATVFGVTPEFLQYRLTDAKI